MEAICKFDELRRKTDRELVHLLKRNLEVGFVACASIALSADHPAAGAGYARARRAALDGLLVLHMLRETGPGERARLETQLRCLERIVKRLGRELFETGDSLGPEPALQLACAR